MSKSLPTWRAARLAMLLSPTLLSACYIVPIAPGPYYHYRPYYPAPYRQPYYRGGYGQGESQDAGTRATALANTTAPVTFASASGVTPALTTPDAASFAGHIDSASSEQ